MNKQPYVAPTIRRVSQATANPQRLGRTPVMEAIDGVPVAGLLGEHGGPLFVFSEAALRAKIRDARRAFAAVYPKTTFAWSYKTNYLNAICRVFHQEGSLAEVVSGFEYEKARANGVPGYRIIFNGPHKTAGELRRAVEEGAMIQVDNRDEVLALAKLADELDREIRLGIRVHVDTGTHAVWSKFGFCAEDGEALRMIEWMTENTRLRVRGVHCHVGTFMLDAGAYATAADAVVRLALAAAEAGCGTVEYLNLGGGFASRARLHGQYLPPEQATPGFDDYARELCGTIKRLWPEGRDLPELLLETGRALVDEAGYLLTKVVAVKQRMLAGGCPALAAYGKGGSNGTLAAYGKGGPVSGAGGNRRNAVVLDAGIQILYTTAWYQPSVYPAAAPAAGMQPTTVYGCLCMNIDVIREEAALPEMNVGDAVVIHPVGAYNITQSMQFISYRPAVVMIDPAGRVHLIRRREVLEDVCGPEQVPEYLAETGEIAEEARVSVT
ncbi:MAG: alanine racemase [Akkermansiaceae bacterium]|nr:alanine racemase [Akkermansiaceae bacterium]MCF7732641.1 alanine racemase [Akkermansiaceae bacterium]